MSVSRAAGLEPAAPSAADFERAQASSCRRRRSRPPARARARDRRPPSSAPTSYHSLCMRVLGEVLAAHRLEGAGADVQRERGALDAARLERVEQRVVEMQRRRRRGDRAGPRREHRLVAPLVVGRRRRARCRAAAARGRGARAARTGRRESAAGTARRRGPPRPSTSASKRSPSAEAKTMRCPACGDLLARSCASTSCGRQHALDQHLDRAAAGLARRAAAP